MRSLKISLLAGAAACFVAAAAHADITVTDLNSSVNFEVSGGKVRGMNAWVVDGVDHLFEQWFWYRTASDTREHRVDELAQSVSGAGRVLDITHTGAGFTIDTLYTLTGGTAGSNTSDIAETIRIINTSSTSSLTMSFFQYSDFDLNGSIPDASVSLVNPNLWRQTDDQPGTVALSEASGVPAATHAEAGYFSVTRDKLDDLFVDDLNDTTSAGPGDLTWAWQWDITLAPGGSFLISKDKQIQPIPAPGAIVLGMMGMSVLGWVKRRVS